MDVTLRDGRTLALDKDEVFRDSRTEAVEWLRKYKEEERGTQTQLKGDNHETVTAGDSTN